MELENVRDCGDGLLIARRPKQRRIAADMMASSGLGTQPNKSRYISVEEMQNQGLILCKIHIINPCAKPVS